ncbi:hypothetical protein AXG93_2446s1230 [Marchantia polymorpha subsp. ruderalis]|uniref:Uncharacterized protein n=1 Tax=Marchantia polymorpha subsp. ruderalis TaxID=1480154 RepID=A0A176W831_MARPO|nr:hypothetical protein AXG93_2446s1230 [Marchantia polymorpha subsp. ruderalis]
MAKRAAERNDDYELEPGNPGVFETRQGPFPPWCVGSVFSPPQLITSDLSPLIFNQVGKPECLISTGHAVEVQESAAVKTRQQTKSFLLSTAAPFVPVGLLEDHLEEDAALIKAEGTQKKQNNGNRLQSVKCSDGNIIIFFPCGKTGEKIGSSLCYPSVDGAWYPIKKSSTGASFDDLDEVQWSVSPSLRQPILQLSAVMVQTDGEDRNGHVYIAARTSYQVFFCVVIREVERIRFMSTYAATFHTHVSHVTWNPHLHREAAVMLESGVVSLFDVPILRSGHDNRVMDLQAKLTLENPANLLRDKFRHRDLESISALAIDVREERSNQGPREEHLEEADAEDKIWWRCEFAWHPQILLLSGSRKVVQVDYRGKRLYESSMQGRGSTSLQSPKCLCDIIVAADVRNARASSNFCYTKPVTEHITAFARAEYDGMCKFSVATEKHLMLFDSRRIGTAILQWEHGMTEEPPDLLIMLQASTLQASSDSGKPRLYQNGRVIVAVNLQSGDMRLFFYGSKVSLSSHKDFEGYDWDDVTYAWEIPLKLYPPKSVANDWNDLLSTSDFKFSKNVRSSPENKAGLECISGISLLSHHSYERNANSSRRGFSVLQLTGYGDILLQQYKTTDQSTILPKAKLDSFFQTAEKEQPWDAQKPKYFVLGAFLRYILNGSTLLCSHPDANNLSEGGANVRHKRISQQEGMKRDPALDLKMEKYFGENHFRSQLKTVVQHLSVPLSMYEVAHTVLRKGSSTSAASLPSDLGAGRYKGYNLRSFLPLLLSGSPSESAVQGMKRYGRTSVPLSALLEVEQLRKLEGNNEALQICGNGSAAFGGEMDNFNVSNREILEQSNFDKEVVPGDLLLLQAYKHVENDLKELAEKEVPSTVSLSDNRQDWLEFDEDTQPLLYGITVDIFSKPNGGDNWTPVDTVQEQVDIAESREELPKKLRRSLNEERACKFVAGKCFKSQGTQKGNELSNVDTLLCPIKLSYTNLAEEPPLEDQLEEQEWTALESLQDQFRDWQQSFGPYSSAYR